MQPDDIPTYAVQAYENGMITVNQQRYCCGLIVTPQGVEANLPPKLSDLQPAHLLLLEKLRLEALVVGTTTDESPPGWLLDWCCKQPVGLEMMGILPACRTLNLLLSDQRVVAALLFP